MFRELDWQIQADDHAAKMEIPEFVNVLEKVEVAELSSNHVSFVEDLTLNRFVHAP